MASDDDFTFCQVSNLKDQEGIEAQKVAQEISVININEGSSSSSSSSSGKSNGVLWKNNGGVSEQQGKVGSLSFNVIDTSKKAKDVPQQKAPAKKPAARAKVPFEKGYSQMDWLKLTRTHPDLAGLKGQSNKRLISINEVRQHQNESSMWTVLKGRVYNIAPYMKFHPGGVDILMKAVGKDCTSLFNKYHAWVNAEFLLEKCLVGVLDETH